MEEKGEDFGNDPGLSGAGPYMFVSWDRGSEIRLTRNDNYYGELPSIKDVVYTVITEAAAGAIAVETGEIHVLLNPNNSDIPHIEASKTAVVAFGSSNFVEFFAMNGSRPPFDNPVVRRAVAMSYDKHELVLAAVDGYGTVVGQFAAPHMFGSIELPAIEKDIEGAKALLAAAGYPNGFEITITTIEGARKRAAEVLQAGLREIGIKANVAVLESSTIVAAGRAGELDIQFGRIGTSDNDVDVILYLPFHSSNIGVINYSHFNNPEIDAQLEASRVEVDPAKREKILQDIIQYIYDETVIMPTYVPVTVNFISADLNWFVESLNMPLIQYVSWNE